MNLRADSFGLLMNLANINSESRVLLVDKTKGFISGALIEKEVKEVLHVELSGNQIKMLSEIL